MPDSVISMGNVFVPEPKQWGLRGDPHLWEAMRRYFDDTPLPANVRTLEQLISQAFSDLTGQDITNAEDFHLEQFAHGGMSSGYISPNFWQKQGMDTLIRNWETHRAKAC